MTRKEFEARVSDALASLPHRFRKAMTNIAIIVEDEPDAELLDEMEIEPPDTLFGLYQGTPLTERGWQYGNTLPDRILLFRIPILDEWANGEDSLEQLVRHVVIHEAGQHFGFSDDDMHLLEGAE